MGTMDVGELIVLAKELKVIGPIVSQRALRRVFAFVQQEEHLGAEEEPDSDDDESEVLACPGSDSHTALACWLLSCAAAQRHEGMRQATRQRQLCGCQSTTRICDVWRTWLQMVYGEFQEAMVAICTYKHPNPYVCLDVRFMRCVSVVSAQSLLALCALRLVFTMFCVPRNCCAPHASLRRLLRFLDQIYREAKALPRFRGKIRWVDRGNDS